MTSAAPSTESLLPLADWQGRRDTHLERLAPVLARLRGYFRKGAHPVYDFLRTYYSFPLSQLENWSPGVRVTLEHGAASYGDQRYWSIDQASGTAWLDAGAFPERRREGLEHAIELLAATASRPGSF